MTDDSLASHARACRNCGHALDGPYCSQCGQSEQDGHPPSLKHFAHDLLHEFLHFDGTIFRTVKALFLEPGRLTEEYMAGRVVRWVRPLRLFLIVAALHLLVSTGIGPMNLQLAASRDSKGQLNIRFGTNPEGMAVAPGSTKVPEEERREILQEFGHRYSELRYLSVLGFALGLWALYWRRLGNYISQVIVSLSFYCFWYLMSMIASVPGRYDPRWNGLSMLSVIYLFLMLGRLYKEHWLLRLVKTGLLAFWLMILEALIGLAAGNWVAPKIRQVAGGTPDRIHRRRAHGRHVLINHLFSMPTTLRRLPANSLT